MDLPSPSAEPLLLSSVKPIFQDSSLALVMHPDASDVDSDVLSSDDAAEDDSDEEDLDFFGRDDLYNSFIQSVFASADDGNDRHSLCSGTDEDDEEYRPQSARGSVGERDLEDDEDDVDIKTITNRELKQLVDYSWRMVTSNAAEFDRTDEKSSSFVNGATATLSEDSRSLKDRNLMSALLEKLLAGEEASGICVDGIQVDSLRRLVARQMSMVLQVLVEMLVLCENRSSCDNECFKYLMELGNYREASIRKATLMKLQTKHVYKCTKRTSDENTASTTFTALNENDVAAYNSDHASDSEEDSVNFHLTRSQVAAVASGRLNSKLGRHTSTSSVFDVAAFADINALLVAIDKGRKTKGPGHVSALSTSMDQIAVIKNMDMHPPLSSQEQWAKSLDSLPDKVKSILTQFSSRVWQCLIPREDYPCRDITGGVVSDPTSLLSRSLFTPAEDDLLLRGLMYVGHIPGSLSSSDAVWTTIHEKFLPSKEKQLLEFRYTQLINTDCPEGTKFKSYLKLMKERGRNQRKWTLEEDIDLLKGFQVYGDKWPMINLYFLPHRSRRELKIRWATLLKESSKTSFDNQGVVRQDGSISHNMSTFLSELRFKGAQAEERSPSVMPVSAQDDIVTSTAFLADTSVSNLGIRKLDCSIFQSLRDADDDVLPDSDLEDGPRTGSSGQFTHYLPESCELFPSAGTGADLMYCNGADYKLDQKIHGISHINFNDSFNRGPSQFGLSVKVAASEKSSVSPNPSMGSPFTPRESTGVLKSSDSPRIVETSLGAFNFTVPHFSATDSTNNTGAESVLKRSVHELNGEPFEESRLMKSSIFSPEKTKNFGNTSEDNGIKMNVGTSLFDRVVRSRSEHYK